MDGVVLISEAYALSGPQGRGLPCIAATSPHCRSKDVVAEFSAALIRPRASFNNLPVIEGKDGKTGTNCRWNGRAA